MTGCVWWTNTSEEFNSVGSAKGHEGLGPNDCPAWASVPPSRHRESAGEGQHGPGEPRQHGVVWSDTTAGGGRVTFKGKVHCTGLPMESDCQSHSPCTLCCLGTQWGAKVKFEDNAWRQNVRGLQWTFWLADLLMWDVKLRQKIFIKKAARQSSSIWQ